MLPLKINAGDTVSFIESYSEYPATDNWSLLFVVVNGQNKYSATSNASGDMHNFLISSATTATWAPGAYKSVLYAIQTDIRHTLVVGDLEIIPDLTQSNSDQRHHVERVLDAIEATLENKASTDQQSMSIAGRSIARYSFSDLLMLRDKYKNELISIKRAERIKNGMSSGGKILVRF